MKIFYSPSTGGFYPSSIYKNPPSDSVEIPEKEYHELLKGEIEQGPKGYPRRKQSENPKNG